MKKTIHRRVEFTTDDIKQALLEFLRVRDQPAPNGEHTTEAFEVSTEGATLVWSEVQ